MTSIAPPDGWELIEGTWGTDIDRNENTSYTHFGDYSVFFKPGKKIIFQTRAFQISQDMNFAAEALIFRTLSAVRQSDILVEAIIIDPSGVSADITETIYNQSGADGASIARLIWMSREKGDGGGGLNYTQAKIRVTYDDTHADCDGSGMYLDCANGCLLKDYFHYYSTATQAIPHNTWTKATFPSRTYRSAYFMSLATGTMRFQRAGRVALSVTCCFAATTDARTCSMKVVLNGVDFAFLHNTLTTSENLAVVMHGSVILPITNTTRAPAGDDLIGIDQAEVQVYHNRGSDLNLLGAADTKWITACYL